MQSTGQLMNQQIFQHLCERIWVVSATTTVGYFQKSTSAMPSPQRPKTSSYDEDILHLFEQIRAQYEFGLSRESTKKIDRESRRYGRNREAVA